MNKLFTFIKREKVFSIALLAAIISTFFVKPDKEYFSYINFSTLALLYCLMVVVSGLRKAGLFNLLANKLCQRASNLRVISISLVLITFFSSMLITNDVALISFVPFAVMVLGMAGAKKELIWVVVCQTLAANLGSMLMPIGNPQNLYLYSYYNYSFFDFLLITLPIWMLSLICIVLLCFKIKKTKFETTIHGFKSMDKKEVLIYAVLFLVCLLVVFKLITWTIMLAIILITVFIVDKEILKAADFVLLATFVWFFIFSGNLARIDVVCDFFAKVLIGREFIVSAAASQIISNVPAALLLSSFTDNGKELVLGTNIGGLGTPIASLASLISFKLYSASKDSKPGKYMGVFLVSNFVLLAVFIVLTKIVLL